MVTVRVVILLAAENGWNIYQINVFNAFLQGDLNEDVYMELPLGFDHQSEQGTVCKLTKSLYGLKQANKFKIKDLGGLRYFLGIEFARSEAEILMHQRKYCLELVADMGLFNSKPVRAPIALNQKLTISEFDSYFPPVGNTDKFLKDPTRYQKLVGRLLYLTLTRTDIAFVVQLLSQFMHKPKISHMEATMRMVKYVKHSPGLGILMTSKGAKQLRAFCDADGASCPNTRQSITGYFVFYGDSLVFWKLKKQNNISKSSTEAEYRSLAFTVAEIIQLGLVQPTYLHTSEQPADLLTKGLKIVQHTYLLTKLGMKNVFHTPRLREDVKRLVKCTVVH
ncbi:uncharacterized mitochondrial protein AtMg00810-like [Capsicum annuum]|uniref:uncharacterized mitochondrial protein AtMg00810-like n=1 Tax=Capsicum annuum TaxID=4072 RepID=UPI001FB0D8CA|nr:uncharacterized mitochondrial protein AtMg00810-like [Capsicum annuum]